jgi:hypothetical protein
VKYTDRHSLITQLFHFLSRAGAVEEGGGLRSLETRLNNRENPFMFRDAMLKLLLAETLPYAKLIAD